MSVPLKLLTVVGLCLERVVCPVIASDARAGEPLVVEICSTRATSRDFDPSKEYKNQLLQLI